MTRPPVVVGAGLAGLTTALRLAPEPCVVLSGGRLGHGAASGWAQGGIAAALGPDDSAARHTADTLATGAGLCDPAAAHRVTAAAPAAVRWLESLGARFDRDASGGYALGLEGAHGRHRIVHAGGDGSGAEIMGAVIEAVRRTPSVTVLERATAEEVLIGADGGVRGVRVRTPSGTTTLETGRVVLATGGAGGLWAHTTNPLSAVGSGIALAARAGATLRDLEMVQFHPTALDVGHDPMPLVSEAVRGAGAVLVNGTGARLLQAGGDLAGRDVVARAVHAELREEGSVALDATGALGDAFADHFPAIARSCHAAGIDPATTPIPVHPAAHYHCGGVLVDEEGRTGIPGLWAVGEVASTGLHGANRLASNSLLEAVVGGGAVAESLGADHRAPSGPGRRLAEAADQRPAPYAGPGHCAPRGRVRRPPAGAAGWLRQLMDEHVGLVRDAEGLSTAVDRLTAAALGEAGPDHLAHAGAGQDDTALVALLVARSALAREESRGGHLRSDHPTTLPEPTHTLIRLDDVLPELLRRTA